MYAVTPIRSATANPGRPAAARQVPLRTTTAPVAPLRAADENSEILAITRSTVQAAMEVLAGIRPIHQLARRLDPRCLAVLQHRSALIRREQARSASPSLARLHRNSIVRSVRACEVAPGIYEASAVVVDDVRARAVAVRLERSKQVWRVTEFMVG
nr:Rv3235 family protein [Pseudarthrobacter psychrotolerans]